jgi:endonuclease YncB( thermonuclease family)
MGLSRVCLAVVLALFALATQAAEKKQWVSLDKCRYVTDKSNDGDSFLIQCGQERFFLRFYFIDAPEAEASFPERVREQYDYFGVTLDELTRAGGRARELVAGKLANRPFTVQTRYSFAQGRSKNTRYYGLVQIDGRYLHEVLLTEGLARNKGTRVNLPDGEKSRKHAQRLQKLEDQARQLRRGVWASHDPAKRAFKSPM